MNRGCVSSRNATIIYNCKIAGADGTPAAFSAFVGERSLDEVANNPADFPNNKNR